MKKNKRLGVIPAIALVLCFGITGCAGNSHAVKSGFRPEQPAQAGWERVKDNTWQLVSVDKGKLRIRLNRKQNESGRAGETYTLSFSGDPAVKMCVRGRGAPNTFFGIFDIGDYPAISISHLVSTKMAAISGQEGLEEHEYFACLEKARRWSMDGAGRLKLVSLGLKGEEVSLIFRKI